MKYMDSAVATWTGKTYFFKDDQYIRYDIADDKQDPGYPKAIASGWPGLWGKGIDAALQYGQLIYFFKGDRVAIWQLLPKADRLIVTDLPLSNLFPGVWSNGIDAAVVLSDSRTYFFKGDQCIIWNTAAHRVEPGYPKPINQVFPGVFLKDLDAVVAWPNDRVYFFKDDLYIRMEHRSVSYFKPIMVGWHLDWAIKKRPEINSGSEHVGLIHGDRVPGSNRQPGMNEYFSVEGEPFELFQRGKSKIVSVKNESPTALSVWLTDSENTTVGIPKPIVIQPGAKVSDFNGCTVGGIWGATGPIYDPVHGPYLNLSVDWVKR